MVNWECRTEEVRTCRTTAVLLMLVVGSGLCNLIVY